MTFKDFDALLDRAFEEMRKLGAGKGKEYANNEQEDRLANFTRIAKAYGIRPEVVCAIYLEKHLDAIRSFVRTGREFSEEKIQGRIRDAQLYMSLLEAIIKDSATSKQKQEQLKPEVYECRVFDRTVCSGACHDQRNGITCLLMGDAKAISLQRKELKDNG